MKKLLSLLTLLLLALHVQAQNGNIKGSVRTSDGQPAQYVSIGLKDSGKGTTTNPKGEYELMKVKAGTYTLIASFVGMEPREVQVVVEENQTTSVPELVLSLSNRQLAEVTIEAERDRKPGTYVAKMPLRDIENPQVYSTVDAQVLKEQVVTNFDDALKNAPGVEKLWESTGRGGDGAGYYSLRGFSVQPKLVNGLPGLTNGSLDPANIERIEVLKGPSGTLFGSSLVSYGGLINTVTKKPYNHFGGEMTYITGSYGLNRISADMNTPLGKENKMAVRLNTAYHTENSFQDAGFRKSLLIAPSLTYQVNDRLSFLIVSEFLNTEGTNPTMLFLDRGAKLTAQNLDELGYDYKRSYTSNNLSISTPTANLQAQLNYKISDNWTSQTAVSRGTSTTDGYYSYLYETSRFYPVDGSVFTRYVSLQNATTTTTDIQQNFIGSFNLTPSVSNKIVAGLDYYQNTAVNNSSNYVTNGLVYIGKADQQMVYDSVYDGKKVPTYDSGTLSRPAMDALFANTPVSNNKTQFATYSAYVSDVINFETIGLSAMASVRFDYFDSKGNVTTAKDDFTQAAVSPKFGLVYQPVKDRVSVFANYMNGFNNVAPAQVADADGTNIRTKTFRPEQANQKEIGVKTNFIKNRLTSTISYYSILVSDKVMNDPANVNNRVQGGKVESKGFEIDLNASPVEGLNIIVGYAYNEATVLSANGGAFSAVGRRPAEAGPQNLANGWATYRFTRGALKGFGAGFGMNSASERVIMDTEGTGRFALPAYTILNASVFYNATDYRITLKVDNLTNEEYYKGWTTINPQRPRSVQGSFSYLF